MKETTIGSDVDEICAPSMELRFGYESASLPKYSHFATQPIAATNVLIVLTLTDLLERRLATTIMRPRHRLSSNHGEVALTFDDGPHPSATEQIVDILKFYEVPATFFIVGERAREYDDVVRLLLDSGHRVGSHSQTHPDPWEVGFRNLRNEYAGAASLVSCLVPSSNCRLFRPPKGYIDLKSAIIARYSGLQTWLWTIDSEDWRPGISADEIVESTKSARSGDVILLHDGLEGPIDDRALDRSATVTALPRLIEAILGNGLSPVVLPA